ncbi:hypothetical protein ACHAWO_003948 [Cyclotella atomus]|uniref:Nudix hydrolase domain-containing protein n=1 Tax=Cyclotella atomus TaxID=382360 RepID=A0ABD3MVK7_9STRA
MLPWWNTFFKVFCASGSQHLLVYYTGKRSLFLIASPEISAKLILVKALSIYSIDQLFEYAVRATSITKEEIPPWAAASFDEVSNPPLVMNVPLMVKDQEEPQLQMKLLPSALIQRTAPRSQSILSSYSQSSLQKNDDAFCPYFRGIPSSSKEATQTSTSSMTSSVRPLISSQELSEWQTPYMPLLTTRQLELTLLEIRRRQKHYRRKQTDSSANNVIKTKREAAIFIPICTVNNIPSILFTRRSGSLSSHASQISFPGGYFDESLDTSTQCGDSYFNVIGNADERLVNTAVREMQEELFFDVNAIQQLQRLYLQDNKQQLPFLSILGQTQPVPSMTGNRVTPIIGQINYDLPHFSSDEFKQLFPGNVDELDWIFTVPIAQLLKEETSEPLTKWGDHDMAKTQGKYEYWGPVFPVPSVKERRDGDRIWGLTASVLRPLLHRVFKQVFVDDGSTSKL